MVNSRTRPLDEVFFALSDPTRRAMLASLARGDLTVSELAEPFDLSAPAISKHLRVLKRAGLLAQERRGRSRSCRFVGEPLREAAQWIEHYRIFWENRLDSLANFFEQTEPPTEKEPS